MCTLWGLGVWCVRGWSDVASIVAVSGILIALYQIGQQSRTAKLTFENLFVQQYQQLIQNIPTKALLGDLLSDEERAANIGEFYHYIDLCNTQAYHHEKHRITRSTWKEWEAGIKSNFERQEFGLVWSYVAYRRESEFRSLQRVVKPAPCDDTNPYLQVGG